MSDFVNLETMFCTNSNLEGAVVFIGIFGTKSCYPFAKHTCSSCLLSMQMIFFHYAQTQQSTFLLPWKPQVFKNCFCPVC